MSIPIINAKDKLLSASSGTMPDVSGALQNYFQPITFETVVKSVVNYKVVETPTQISFQGVWQPFTAQQLMMKPEGQRKWKWFWLHAEPGVPLTTDDCPIYQGVQYRVMSVKDYTLDGYMEYTLVEDYTGAGP